MKQEKYIADIGKDGSRGLGTLDHCFNQTTQAFLLSSGLKPGMTILDIGCGSGVMTCWMAQQVGPKGKVIGIENNENQLHAAQKRADSHALANAAFRLCSAYDIESLHEQFDLVYCRFVLHHLIRPVDVIAKIFQILKPNGIYVSEEGIVNHAFSYPFSHVWGDECVRLTPPWVDYEGVDRDGNVGIKMVTKMRHAGFQILSANVVQPLLITREEKALLLLGREELKRHFLEEGHTEAEWIAAGEELENVINNDAQIIGFYGSCQVAGVKPA
jgi:cyclopropane fatty-acyl-phospholipid synthase-like methyltransferase